jgi:zinc transport system permease protein
MFAVCADEDFARVLGLRVRAYNLLIVVLAAITVTTAMRTVGLLLVSALMVIPVATSQNLFKGFRSGLYGAMGIGVVVALSGVFGSFYADVPPGAFIVVLAIAAFAVSWPISSWRHRRRPLASVDEVEPLPHEPTPDLTSMFMVRVAATASSSTATTWIMFMTATATWPTPTTTTSTDDD